MKKRRQFKLLTKTTAIYLVFTFVAFLGSAIFLTHEADEFIDRNLNIRFRKSEQRLVKYISQGKPLQEIRHKVTPLAALPPDNPFPVYADTAVFSAELDGMERLRLKTVVFEVDGRFYKATISKSVEDFLRLRDDVFGALVPAFVVLAIGIVVFNFFLSGYFFQPFNRILGLMRTYKVGHGAEVKKVDTTTREFSKMQELFHRMLERIEHDYRHLKEYTENMAHEIQTPLTVIRSKTENLIADETVMQKHAETVKIIYEETNHLSRLGTTLNLITRIENGEFTNSVRIETGPVIEKHVAAVRELAELKSLNIETDLNDAHHLTIDPFLLDIVLKNLLRNAISYGSAAGPICIKTTADDLRVSNFGPPLKDHDCQLFERFYRSNHDHNSSGLGLALVKKICELNNLRIEHNYEHGQHIFAVVGAGSHS